MLRLQDVVDLQVRPPEVQLALMRKERDQLLELVDELRAENLGQRAELSGHVDRKREQVLVIERKNMVISSKDAEIERLNDQLRHERLRMKRMTALLDNLKLSTDNKSQSIRIMNQMSTLLEHTGSLPNNTGVSREMRMINQRVTHMDRQQKSESLSNKQELLKRMRENSIMLKEVNDLRRRLSNSESEVDRLRSLKSKGHDCSKKISNSKPRKSVNDVLVSSDTPL